MKEIKWQDAKPGQPVKIEHAGRLRTIKPVNAEYGEIIKDPEYPKTEGLHYYPAQVPGKVYEIPPKPPRATKATPKRAKSK